MATCQGFAKINLSLDVLGKREEDGYHLLRMVMQSVSLADQVSMEFTQDARVFVQTNLPYLPSGDQNLAGKAAKLYWAETNTPPKGLKIHIEKKIPVCAGLAGGSTDGAAVLRMLNDAAEHPVSKEELSRISLKTGSDVPYCLLGGTALAEGTGEILTPLPPMPFCYILLCKPNFSISTPELFQKIDTVRLRHRPDTEGLMEAIRQQDLVGIAQRLFNVFEEALSPRQHQVISEIKNTMLDFGALGASMSGSGPTVLGIFSTEAEAQTAMDTLSPLYPETFLTTPV